MPTWKLTIEYDGTRYRGWQSQKNTDRTVQGMLLRAATELLGEDASVGGAGRTDAGVHAMAQVAHLKARRTMPEADVAYGLNEKLPFDIHVLAVEKAPPRFHARHDAKSPDVPLPDFPAAHRLRQTLRLVGQGPTRRRRHAEGR